MKTRRETADARKRRAWRFGQDAEALAVLWLRLKGYRIAARRFRTPAGEIDIVAARGRTVAFVEVKARAAAEDGSAAEDVLSTHQRRRITRAAEGFLKLHPDLADFDLRFDLIFVGRGQRPRHLIAAWRADD